MICPFQRIKYVSAEIDKQIDRRTDIQKREVEEMREEERPRKTLIPVAALCRQVEGSTQSNVGSVCF